MVSRVSVSEDGGRVTEEDCTQASGCMCSGLCTPPPHTYTNTHKSNSRNNEKKKKAGDVIKMMLGKWSIHGQEDAVSNTQTQTGPKTQRSGLMQ